MRTRADPEVADWLKHAADDEQTARLVSPHGLHAIVGFHCQQEAEKLLKACAVALELEPPRVHHLPTLLDALERAGVVLPDIADDCRLLTPFATVSRYPGHGDLSADDAALALAAAGRVRGAVLAALRE